MSRLVLQIAGQPGCGKSEVSGHLAESYGFMPVVVSGLIRNYADEAGIELIEREDYRLAHENMRRELGDFALVQSILSLPSQRICVDGLRVPAHAERLHEHGPIIALHCRAEVRHQRVVGRGRSLDKPSLADFLHDEAQEARTEDPFSQGTLTVMDFADYDVDSSRPLTRVLGEVSSIVKPLLG